MGVQEASSDAEETRAQRIGDWSRLLQCGGSGHLSVGFGLAAVWRLSFGLRLLRFEREEVFLGEDGDEMAGAGDQLGPKEYPAGLFGLLGQLARRAGVVAATSGGQFLVVFDDDDAAGWLDEGWR